MMKKTEFIPAKYGINLLRFIEQDLCPGASIQNFLANSLYLIQITVSLAAAKKNPTFDL